MQANTTRLYNLTDFVPAMGTRNLDELRNNLNALRRRTPHKFQRDSTTFNLTIFNAQDISKIMRDGKYN